MTPAMLNSNLDRPSDPDGDGAVRLRQGYLPTPSNFCSYRLSYLRMIFDPSVWCDDAIAQLGSSLASLYATVMVVMYVAFGFTEIVTYPDFKEYLEVKGFFVYLFAVSIVFLVWMLLQLLLMPRCQCCSSKTLFCENDKSHGCLAVRFGALLFGLGTLCFFMLELLSYSYVRSGSPCYHGCKVATSVLGIAFVLLQACIIFCYPRLNLVHFGAVNRLGTMHVAATNIILWLRTLLEESMEEIMEFELDGHVDGSILAAPSLHQHGDPECNVVLSMVKKVHEHKTVCQQLRNELLGDKVANLMPYLYPFVVEFALIGASVFYIMSVYVGKRPSGREAHLFQANRARAPNPMSWRLKTDCSHSFKGTMAGLFVLTVASANLTLFLMLNGRSRTMLQAEYACKVINTVINALGIVALVIGLAEIQQLDQMPESNSADQGELDIVLLRFSSFFSFLYMLLTIITGLFSGPGQVVPSVVHVVNGVFSIVEISLQIAFTQQLKRKALPKEREFARPGRQITVFLSIFNIAQWVVLTFETQRARSSPVEAEFFGFMPWVMIRRVTLPLAVFFRFHSSVVCIELFKLVFSRHHAL